MGFYLACVNNTSECFFWGGVVGGPGEKGRGVYGKREKGWEARSSRWRETGEIEEKHTTVCNICNRKRAKKWKPTKWGGDRDLRVEKAHI